MLTVDTASLDATCAAWLAAFERAADDALEYAAETTAAQARASHWYRNRTRNLEGSTQAIPGTVGSVWDDSLRTWVVASELYASYVDARSPILAPAYDARASEIASGVESIFATVSL